MCITTRNMSTCYCDRPAAQLDGRWVCAELVEGDFCILGREND